MNLIRTLTENKLNIALIGSLDTNTAPQLEEVLNDSLDNITELIFDFKETDYLSSAGLRVLLAAQKKMSKQGSLVLINVP
ncbi:MAG TPA: STAS domain-containing protein [Lachnospiraceae bacterium]|nr:STAS domain-containing protein [Lachnospiraceae bacterium]